MELTKGTHSGGGGGSYENPLMVMLAIVTHYVGGTTCPPNQSRTCTKPVVDLCGAWPNPIPNPHQTHSGTITKAIPNIMPRPRPHRSQTALLKPYQSLTKAIQQPY